MHISQLPDFLLQNQDEAYRRMQLRLIPNVDPSRIVGVRTPVLRAAARELEEKEAFINSLPHSSFEENQIHCFLLEREKDFSYVVGSVERFLPFVDNWATCDQLRPGCFKKHHEELLPYIRGWIACREPYTIRFGIGMLMAHFLDADFDEALLELPAGIQSDEYYVRMMIAWFFATALAKQYDAAFPYIANKRLEEWVHNKTIQKAIESYRITPEQKLELKAFRIQ